MSYTTSNSTWKTTKLFKKMLRNVEDCSRLKIDLFRLGCLLPHYRPRDNSLLSIYLICTQLFENLKGRILKSIITCFGQQTALSKKVYWLISRNNTTLYVFMSFYLKCSKADTNSPIYAISKHWLGS